MNFNASKDVMLGMLATKELVQMWIQEVIVCRECQVLDPGMLPGLPTMSALLFFFLLSISFFINCAAIYAYCTAICCDVVTVLSVVQ